MWVWQDDRGYSELSISERGTGWSEFGNAEFKVIDEFRWRVSPPDQIHFEYGDNREVEADGTVEYGWTRDPSSQPYELLADDRGPAMILHLNPPDGRKYTRRSDYPRSWRYF